MSMMVTFCAVLFSARDVLDEIWHLIESVSEGFPNYSSNVILLLFYFLLFRVHRVYFCIQFHSINIILIVVCASHEFTSYLIY